MMAKVLCAPSLVGRPSGDDAAGRREPDGRTGEQGELAGGEAVEIPDARAERRSREPHQERPEEPDRREYQLFDLVSHRSLPPLRRPQFGRVDAVRDVPHTVCSSVRRTAGPCSGSVSSFVSRVVNRKPDDTARNRRIRVDSDRNLASSGREGGIRSVDIEGFERLLDVSARSDWAGRGSESGRPCCIRPRFAPSSV